MALDDLPVHASVDTLAKEVADEFVAVRLEGRELGYAEITSNVVQTGAGSQDVAGLSITVEVGDRPIRLEFGCGALSNSLAAGLTSISLMEGAVVLASANAGLAAAGTNYTITRAVRLNPSPGTHTYKINLAQVTSGNCTLGASATTPAYITAIEV